jgi:hypothetical protein
MTDWLIVGGGISGMLAAHGIRGIGQKFLGVEKADKLGGRAVVGPHRLYAPNSSIYLGDEFPAVTWEFIDDKPQERHKGEWIELKSELEPSEQYYTRSPFFRPVGSFGVVIDSLTEEVSEEFRFHVYLEELDPEAKRAVFSSGEEVSYEKLLWCAPLDALTKLLRDRMPRLPRGARSGASANGGLSYEVRLSENPFPSRNAIVLPFRYKDHRLRALGFSSPVGEAEFTVRWIVTLEKELADDPEEVAKCVRALKREVAKEFTELPAIAKGERIIFLPRVTGESAPAIDSLELLPNLFYVGAELRQAEVSGDLGSLDLAVANYQAFLGALTSGDAPLARSSEDAVQRDC